MQLLVRFFFFFFFLQNRWVPNVKTRPVFCLACVGPHSTISVFWVMSMTKILFISSTNINRPRKSGVINIRWSRKKKGLVCSAIYRGVLRFPREYYDFSTPKKKKDFSTVNVLLTVSFQGFPFLSTFQFILALFFFFFVVVDDFGFKSNLKYLI